MPPRNQNQNQNQNQMSTDDDVASLVSSQSSVTTMDFVQRANEMMADTKKRRDAKRTKIETDRAKRIKDVQKKIEALYEDRRTRRAKIQKAQWNHLYSLNKRRQELENQILKSITFIEGKTLSMARELNTVLLGRIAALRDLGHTQSAA
ncbi:hypothetical protein DSL72_000534 [Monilinia vaccinii-corymbosi]|uniref:Uncharacterized protein n=1 Tax=Monilinia vaccinii-corymbosi TaxID=61207 RepID=A0A8A3P4G7_9HELO|nr:hypothetical protein DSL72_000534 [Monilinia vaccinii-corymbosi]